MSNRGKREKLLGVLVISLSLGYGCAQIAGLEEPMPSPQGSSSSGGGTDTSSTTSSTTGGSGGVGGQGGSAGAMSSSTASSGGMGGMGGQGGMAGQGGMGGQGGSGGCPPLGQPIVTGQIKPTAISTDPVGGAVYWVTEGTDDSNRAVWKMDKTCDPPVMLTLTSVMTMNKTPVAIAVDSTHVYWADGALDLMPPCPQPDRDRVMRIHKTMLTISPVFQGCGRAQSVDLDPGKTYWTRTSSNRVERANKDGTMPQTLFSGMSNGPFAIAADDGNIVYWTENATSKVVMWDKNTMAGMNADFAISPSPPTWIDLDMNTVYWTTTSQLYKLDKATPMIPPVLLFGMLLMPGAIAVDPNTNFIYVANTGTGDIVRVTKNQTGVTMIAPTSDVLSGVAIDDTYVYWTNTTTGEIWRDLK